jgi:hypothetical protein
VTADERSLYRASGNDAAVARFDPAPPPCPLDVDLSGRVEVATDVVYIARHAFGIAPVPPSFRVSDPTIPADDVIAAAIDALCDRGSHATRSHDTPARAVVSCLPWHAE